MKKIYALLGFISLVSSSLLAQITGTVTDTDTKSGLPGVSVVVKGTVAGAPTDNSGKFSIPYNGKYPVTVRVSFVGFKTQDIEVKSAGNIDVSLEEAASIVSELTVTANRVEEKITKSPVTVEKLTGRQLLLGGAFDQYSALQALKGVDLLTQSLTFKSVNVRGFGANNNNRFVQLVDGMDNRSPGYGFGFGSVAGVSDLDIDNIELLPGASSALYGPDALQGLMLTKTKSPFDYQGLSAQVKVGINNVGKSSGPNSTPYTDLGIRYAKAIGKFAFKANFQAINGTDFIADDYDNRSHRGRPGFFTVGSNAVTIDENLNKGANNLSSSNLTYDGVNIYGDDFNNGGVSALFPATHPVAALAGKQVTRTGYREIDLTGDNGKIFSYRANAAVHYKITDKIEAIGAIYWGNGNLIRTAGFREYYPDYKRTQMKLEVRGDNFFVRGYNTSQNAEGFNLGNLAARILQSQKSMATWANDFSTAYGTDANIDKARAAADANKLAVGSAGFTTAWNALTNTKTTDNTTLLPAGSTTPFRGVRVKDNSSMQHFEGMYNLNNLLPEGAEVVMGASYRSYNMLTESTIFPTKKDGSGFKIKEYGAYAQAAYRVNITDNVSIKPVVAVRYDKNEFFKGGLTPRVSGVLSLGEHNFRGSWQKAFRNPSPNQLLSDGKTGEVGGSQAAVESANLLANPGYYEASVVKFRSTGNVSDLLKFDANPDKFTTEKITTWEVGYKTLIANALYLDVFYYSSKYKDFIAAQNILQPQTVGSTDALKASATTNTFQVNFNNFNEIFVNGFGGELSYSVKGYTFAVNYANQVGTITLKDNLGNTLKDAFNQEIVKRKMSNYEVSRVQRNFFISPENRFNFSVSNPKVTKNVGFTLNYRWTDKMWVEQGTTAGDIWLPSWQTIDAAVSYKVPKIRTIIKLGATNLANQYYSQGYGLARIGGMYYLSFNFDEALNR